MAEQLLADGRPVVEDVRAGPVTFSQSCVEEHAQVVPDGAEREAGHRHQLRGGDGVADQKQDLGPGRAEQPPEWFWRRGVAGPANIPAAG